MEENSKDVFIYSFDLINFREIIPFRKSGIIYLAKTT
jgi:hypothetical protein